MSTIETKKNPLKLGNLKKIWKLIRWVLLLFVLSWVLNLYWAGTDGNGILPKLEVLDFLMWTGFLGVGFILLALCWMILTSLNEKAKHLKSLRGETSDDNPWFFILTTATAIVSGFTSYRGFQSTYVSMGDGELLYYGFPLLVGLFTVVMVSGVWNYLMFLCHQHADDKGVSGFFKKLPILIVAMATSVGFFALSTNLSVIGFSGDDAVKYHMNLAIQEQQKTLSDVNRYISKESKLKSKLEIYAQRFADQSTAERNTGQLTGQKGNGAVERQLDSYANSLTIGIHELEKQSKLLDSEVGELTSLLRSLETDLSAKDFESLRNMEIYFSENIIKTQHRISALLNTSMTEAIAGYVGTIETFTAQPALSGNIDFAEKQSLALVNLSNALDAVVNDLNKSLTALEDRPLPELSYYKAMNVTDAIFEYWHVIYIGWAFAIACDHIPFLLIFLAFCGIVPRLTKKE